MKYLKYLFVFCLFLSFYLIPSTQAKSQLMCGPNGYYYPVELYYHYPCGGGAWCQGVEAELCWYGCGGCTASGQLSCNDQGCDVL